MVEDSTERSEGRRTNINTVKEDVTVHLRKCHIGWFQAMIVFIASGGRSSTSLHQTVGHLDECIKTWDVPDWMVESRTVLIH